MRQILAGVPVLLDGQVGALGGLVVVALALVALGGRVARDAVDRPQSGDRGLDADRPVSLIEVRPHVVEQLGKITAGCVAVGHQSGSGCAAEQLVQRHPGGFRLDVPQRDIDGGDRRHRHRPAAPVCAAVEKLPGVLDLVGVPADQQRNDVITQIAHDRQFAAVERRIPEARETVVGRELEGHKVAVGAGDDDLGGLDLHGRIPFNCATGCWLDILRMPTPSRPPRRRPEARPPCV